MNNATVFYEIIINIAETYSTLCDDNKKFIRDVTYDSNKIRKKVK